MSTSSHANLSKLILWYFFLRHPLQMYWVGQKARLGFHKVLRKNLNDVFGQSNISLLAVSENTMHNSTSGPLQPLIENH